jgi:glycosyltransferase involved in cell wall biosynthesis
MSSSILHIAPYAVTPPRYGTAMRTYCLCREASHAYDVKLFAQKVQKQDINIRFQPKLSHTAPNFVEYASCHPLTLAAYILFCLKLNAPYTGQSSILNLTAPPWLRQELEKACLVNVEFPWQFPWVYQQVGGKKPIVLTAHNVELELFSPERLNLPRSLAKRFMNYIEHQERFAVQHADCIFAMSEENITNLCDLYDISAEKCVVIPNGVDCEMFTPIDPVVRSQRKHALNLVDKQVITFSGAAHPPNIEAVQQILAWADNHPDPQLHYLIIGGVGRSFAHSQRSNVTFTGFVEDTRPYFEATDIAINPMISGSGTNLKQVEYMAMGLPSVTTPKGARGISLQDGTHAFITPLDEFPERLKWLIAHPEVGQMMGVKARNFVTETFDWSIIGKKMVEVYQSLEVSHSQPSRLVSTV